MGPKGGIGNDTEQPAKRLYYKFQIASDFVGPVLTITAAMRDIECKLHHGSSLLYFMAARKNAKTSSRYFMAFPIRSYAASIPCRSPSPGTTAMPLSWWISFLSNKELKWPDQYDRR
jgi:hypothetical protein